MKKSPKTQAATLATSPKAANLTAPRRAAEDFVAVSERLATALADTVDHGDCPPWLQQRIAELHSGLMSEFVCDVGDDIRLRFALGAQKASEGHRPAD
jgi:hypothetical protein